MKKLGLVTVTYVDNFGSHLQSFALQQKLSKLGFPNEIININSAIQDIRKRRYSYVASRIFNFNEMSAYLPVLQRKLMLRLDNEYCKILSNRAQMFKNFASTKYTIAEKVNGWSGLTKQCYDNYDAVIVGSDQNWRPANIAGGFYTLEFVPDEINKIAYSTSFGIDHVIDAQKEKAKYFLGRINHLSVREESGKRIVKKLLNRDIPVVCDPTLLHSARDWDTFVGEKPVVEGSYILCYFLGSNKEHWDFVKRLKEKTGLKIVGIPYGEQYIKGAASFMDKIPMDIGPFEFVKLIRNASYVCTDSFHGCAFALVYNKNFFAFYKHAKKGGMSTNNRIDNMLGWAGISNRILTGKEEIEQWMVTALDYTEANRRIQDMRQSSLNYLTKALANK